MFLVLDSNRNLKQIHLQRAYNIFFFCAFRFCFTYKNLFGAVNSQCPFNLMYLCLPFGFRALFAQQYIDTFILLGRKRREKVCLCGFYVFNHSKVSNSTISYCHCLQHTFLLCYNVILLLCITWKCDNFAEAFQYLSAYVFFFCWLCCRFLCFVCLVVWSGEGEEWFWPFWRSSFLKWLYITICFWTKFKPNKSIKVLLTLWVGEHCQLYMQTKLHWNGIQ